MANIRKLPSGKYQARVMVDGVSKSIGTFKTKTQAKIEAGKAEERLLNNQSLDDRHITFDEVAHQWLNNKQKRLREATFEVVESQLRIHILPFFKGRRILSIKRKDVHDFVDHLKNKRYRNGTMKYEDETLESMLSKLKSIFFFAQHELEVITKNPADNIKIPPSDEMTDDKTKFYTYEELQMLLSYMREYKQMRFPAYQYYYAVMYFLSETGLRISEAMAVKWSDIDGDMLNVERQVDTKNPVPSPFKPLKTPAAYRKIKLSEELMTFLKQFKQTQNKLSLQYPTFIKGADGLIFQSYKGHYVHPAVVRDEFKKHCRKAGIDYRGTHCFRHTHAVMLLEAGASPKYIADRLGHESVKTTMDTYMHISAKMEEDELQKLASYKQRKNNLA